MRNGNFGSRNLRAQYGEGNSGPGGSGEFGGWGRHGRGILFIITYRSGGLNVSGKRIQGQLYNAPKH